MSENNSRTVRTVKMKWTWKGLIRQIAMLYMEGTSAEAQKTAEEELLKVAEGADRYNALLEDPVQFLNQFDGYGLVVTDEDLLRERAQELFTQE